MDIHINSNKENFMKKMIMVVLVAIFATAANAEDGADKLRKVEAEYVCMVNNMAYDKQQVEAVVDGKTYYGCCPMCKEKLEKSPALRKAIDPVSGKEVDKADAVIGAIEDGMVHYFENEANLEKFSVEMKHDESGSTKESHSGHKM
jgi:YHS domain-containing protein